MASVIGAPGVYVAATQPVWHLLPARAGKSKISLFNMGSGDRLAQSGLVLRYHLHPDAEGLSLSGSHHGLVDPQGAVVATVEHRSRLAVHDATVHGRAPDTHQHGRTGPPLWNC